MKESLSYKDVILEPRYSEVESRDYVSTSVEFLGHYFRNPIVPSNMSCTIDLAKAKELADNEYFYILHRFYEYTDILNWIEDNQDLDLISISVGVKEKDYYLINNIFSKKLRVDFITIDVAHGHNINVKKICQYFHSLNWNHKPKLIVGNIGTQDAAHDLISWGADALKIGLSMGKACTTYNTTGVGTPMYSTVSEISNYTLKVPLIADGQIREVGDVAKAVHAGAKLVMVGSMFAACIDSPAEFNFYKTHKNFYGSASAENKGHKNYVEGKSVLLECNNLSMLDLMKKFEQGLKSTMSYAGVDDLSKLHLMGVRKIYA
jgi:GMP reductase